MNEQDAGVFKSVRIVEDTTEERSADSIEETSVPLNSPDALRSSESRAAAFCRMLLDEEGRPKDFILESVNPAFERLFGVSAERAGGCSGSSFFGNEEEVPLLDLFACAMTANEPFSRMIIHEKFRRVFDILVFPAEKGVFCAAFTDLTEQRRTEAELRESEQRHEAAFTWAGAVMLLVDPETGAIVDCNDAALNFYGYSREEMLALKNSDFNLLSPEEIRRCIEQASTFRRNCFVMPHRLKSGEVRTVEVHCSQMPYEGRTLLFSIVLDVTEKLRLEEELKMLAFDFSVQAKVLGSILECSSDFLYVLDRERRFRFVGKKGAALFHFEPEKMVGMTLQALEIPEERTPLFEEHLEEVFASGKPKRGLLVLPTAKGDKPLEYSLDGMYDENGDVDSVFCSMRMLL